jgi:peptidoglycan/xylan/chitin deacetylase (PgdA/CDA1 family)/glycosyltransferase involved in cell wall biosynthesis
LNGLPRFSIVIPTYRRREIVARNVTALERQQQRDFEVIVAVDGSGDGTAAELRALGVTFPLTVLERENEGAALARNAAAAVARGELLLFLDDDMEADPQMLAEHDRSHGEGADIVLGHLPLHPDSPDTLLSQGVGRWAEKRRQRLDGLAGELPVTENNTGQMSVPRAAFEELGGFDVSFTKDGLYGGEDFDFGYRARRAGLAVVFNPAAVSYQFYAVDPAVYTRRTREAGRASLELQDKHPELTQDLAAGRVFTTRRSRIILGCLSRAPHALSWPLRALAEHRVRAGRLDFHTYRLFYGLQTMEYHRGVREARRKLRTRGVVVLAYHAIANLEGDPVLAEYGVPATRFAAQLDALARRGHLFIGLEQLLGVLDGGTPPPDRAALVTFDDGYADLLSDACPVLSEREIRAAAFVVAGRIGATNEWDTPLGARALPLLDDQGLRAVAAQGVAVGSHGMTHRRLAELEPGELEQELEASAQRLSELGLQRPVALSYPYGVSSPATAAAVRDAGYALAFTVDPGIVRRGADRYALPRIEVLASDTPRKLRLKIATAEWPAGRRERLFRWLRVRY